MMMTITSLDDIDVLIDEYSRRYEIHETVRKVIVTCPTCGATGAVDVPECIVESSENGIARVPIVPGTTCGHAYMANIDKRYQSR